MECLETRKVCPNNNLKCKNCKLDDCRNVIKAIEEEQKMWIVTQEQKFIKQMKKEFPSCVINGKLCSQLEVLDLEKGKVRCPYMINKRCVLK